MSNPWIRLYRESLHDPKIVLLSDRQHRAWHNCLLIADDTGTLPSLRDIAVHMRMTVTDAEQMLIDLVEAELIDADMLSGARTYRMHGWAKRQYASDISTQRSQKHRAKKSATAMQRCSDGQATPPEPNPEAESESRNLTSEQGSARESELDEIKSFARVGLGRGGVVSTETKRRVAVKLGIGSAEPLVAIYEDWSASKTALDPDALFASQASKFYRGAEPEVRAACQPLTATTNPEPIPKPSARPSSSLIAALNKGKRYGVPTH